MGIFSKKTTNTGGMDDAKMKRLSEFGAEAFACLVDGGRIDTTQVTRLRSLARRLNMTKEEIIEANAYLTMVFIEKMKDAGIDSESAGRLTKAIIAELSKI